MYAKKNYEKYLSALKNSGLVSVEDKAQGAAADVTVGAEGGAGAMVLLGKMTITHYMKHIFINHLSAVENRFKTVLKLLIICMHILGGLSPVGARNYIVVIVSTFQQQANREKHNPIMLNAK